MSLTEENLSIWTRKRHISHQSSPLKQLVNRIESLEIKSSYINSQYSGSFFVMWIGFAEHTTCTIQVAYLEPDFCIKF